MSALDILREDHNLLCSNLVDIAETPLRFRRDLVATLEEELRAHIDAEQALLEPFYLDAIDGRPIHGLHHTAVCGAGPLEGTLAGAMACEPGSDLFRHQLHALMLAVGDHVDTQEERVFPFLEATCDQESLEALGARLLERRTSRRTAPTPQPMIAR